MKELKVSSILESLRIVRDPDLQRDIVSLGFVKDLRIEGKDVSFTIELTTPACPVREELKGAAIRAVRESVEGVANVTVEMTSRVTRHVNQQKADVLPGVKNTIAVASGKGGVGKSTVAVNLAVALAKEGARVGLVDADIYGPSIPLMMGISGRPRMNGQRLLPMEKWGVKVMSIGFLVDPMQAVIWRGPMASGAVKQFMSDVEWGELDYLVFDLPPRDGRHSAYTRPDHSPDRCGDRYDTAGHISGGRTEGLCHVREGECPGPWDDREHELLHLHTLRATREYF